MNRAPTHYDLLACNLVLASIADVLMAAVGSSVKVVQILEGVTVAGFNIDLLSCIQSLLAKANHVV